MGINGTCTCFRYFVEKSASCAAVARWLGGGGGGGGGQTRVRSHICQYFLVNW